ncbi:hypothetical protein FG386_000086 [Cryptosporidium ryanae]|uniref:uncharacterized protein n=1 Tax=Cryptosporidium ryanae TaxID=515981 RepID=UPI003519FE6A|nr:hypothetical protein FG386_000086 [Cryptosporidium ryanae]
MDNERTISSVNNNYLSFGVESNTLARNDDLNNVKRLENVIELLVYIQLIISLFLCIGRNDYNFILYLLGYYIFCAETAPLDVNSLIRKITGIRRYLMLIVLATLIEIVWLSFAASGWTCPSNQSPDVCFVDDFQMNWELQLHIYIIWGSFINLILKFILGISCWMWINRERNKLESISLKPLLFYW